MNNQICSETQDFINKYFDKGFKMDNILEAILYYHNKNLFGKDMYRKPFTLDMIIQGLNTFEAVEMLFETGTLETLVNLHLRHVAATKESNDLKLVTCIETGIEAAFRSFFGVVSRFTNI